jgi:CheY-like chemotaxis protein
MSTRKVLVIDDEDAVREVVQGCFEEVAGWQVVTANSGQEGWEKVLTERPEAIVVDPMMSEMGEVPFLRVFSTNSATRSIPIVLLTARVDLVDPAAFSLLDVRGAIAKPFDPFMLVRQVAEFLDWSIEV